MAKEPMPARTFADARKSAMTRLGSGAGAGAMGGAPMDAGMDGGMPDAETGYVEHANGPICGNCNHLSGTACMHPKVMKPVVSPSDGSCDYWDDGSGQPGIDTTDTGEAAMGPTAAPPTAAPPSGSSGPVGY